MSLKEASAGGTGSCPPDEKQTLAVHVPHPAAAWRKRFAPSFVRHIPVGDCRIYKGGIFMPIFKTPFSKAYWREALRSLRSVRCMVFAAMMIAVCMALSLGGVKLVLGENLSFSFSFLARALCALVYGPVGGMVFAAAEDTLSFFVSSGGYPYFPGYAVTTMLGCLWYGLFFYRARITWVRIILAKTITNVQNVLLGSLWSAILYSKGYLFYAAQSAVKNLIFLPLQIILLGVVFAALLPVLRQSGMIPNQLGEKGYITWV